MSERLKDNTRGYRPCAKHYRDEPMVCALYRTGATAQEACDMLASALIDAKRELASVLANRTTTIFVAKDPIDSPET